MGSLYNLYSDLDIFLQLVGGVVPGAPNFKIICFSQTLPTTFMETLTLGTLNPKP